MSHRYSLFDRALLQNEFAKEPYQRDYIRTIHASHRCVINHSHVTYERIMSHMNESCHIQMCRGMHERVMSHMNHSCQTWMSHLTYEWVMSHMNESCHIWMSHVTYETMTCHEWTMGWLRLVGSSKLQVSIAEYSLFHRALLQKRPIMLRSLRLVATPYLQVMSHIWINQVTYMNQSCHMWMSCVTHVTSHLS